MVIVIERRITNYNDCMIEVEDPREFLRITKSLPNSVITLYTLSGFFLEWDEVVACHSEISRFVSGSYSKIHDSSPAITFYWKSGLSRTQSRSTRHACLSIHWLTPSAPNVTRKHLIDPWHHFHKYFSPFHRFHLRFYRVCSKILLRNAAQVNGSSRSVTRHLDGGGCLFTNWPTLRKSSETLLTKIPYHSNRMKRFSFVTPLGR